MVHFLRRWLFFLGLTVLSLTTILHCITPDTKFHQSKIDKLTRPGFFHPKFSWKNVPQRHPVANFTALPTGPLANIPRIQARFRDETPDDQPKREYRLNAVKEAFQHSWGGYKTKAWLHDEVGPLSGLRKNEYGGWAATLVDSLDTLWIMGMTDEFSMAVSALKKIDFTN